MCEGVGCITLGHYNSLRFTGWRALFYQLHFLRFSKYVYENSLSNAGTLSKVMRICKIVVIHDVLSVTTECIALKVMSQVKD